MFSPSPRSLSNVRPGVDISEFSGNPESPQQQLTDALQMCPAKGMERTVQYQAACVQNQLLQHSLDPFTVPNTYAIEKSLTKCPNSDTDSKSKCMFYWHLKE